MNNEVSNLLYTSVEDMKATLSCAMTNGDIQANILLDALFIAIGTGEITRARILRSYLRRLDVWVSEEIPCNG